MADPNFKRSDNEEAINEYSEIQSGEIKRCADCGTSRTPLWRGGPAGPKSLCNACGIRSRKKRRAIMGLKSEEKKAKKNSSGKLGSPLHERLIALGREVMMQRSRVDNKTRRRKLGEEEEAAVLLMALSYGSAVFA